MTPSQPSTNEWSCHALLRQLERIISREQLIIFGPIALLLFAIILSSTACSPAKNENATPNASGGGHTGASADTAQPSPPAPPSSSAPATPTTWEAKAVDLKGADGQTFTFSCSPGGTEHSVWGSDIYTADSSICSAAVNSGLITLQQGGTVTIELRPGRNIYGCNERNGVTTSCYGRYLQSFVFKTPDSVALVREADEETPVLWTTAPTMVGFEAGKTVKFKCPPNGREGSVWGTDIYTLDSSICNAAVHAGKFTRESGGPVTIELRPGESSYKGSTRNGVKTNDYEKYGSSFVVK